MSKRPPRRSAHAQLAAQQAECDAWNRVVEVVERHMSAALAELDVADARVAEQGDVLDLEVLRRSGRAVGACAALRALQGDILNAHAAARFRLRGLRGWGEA